jgi:hypothetical protein
MCSGRKFELDAASNPLLYSSSFGATLARHLTSGRARRFAELAE